MSAECEKCGADLVGTQWDEGGLQCVPCDLRAELVEARGLLKEAMEHCNELREAWERGLLREPRRDHGMRSGRNLAVVVSLRAYLRRVE